MRYRHLLVALSLAVPVSTLSGCADDDVAAEGTETSTDETTDSNTEDTTSTSDEGTTSDTESGGDGDGDSSESTGDGDGDGDGTGDGDGDGTGGDGDGDGTGGDGDGDGGDGGDGDGGDGDGGDGDAGGDGDGDTGGDGDGDGDEGGIVIPDCGAGSSFGFLTSTNNGIDVTLEIDSTDSAIKCTKEVTLITVGGEITSVPDGADGCYYTIESVSFADTPPMDCNEGLSESTVTLENIEAVDDGNGMQVVVGPQGGAMTGNQDILILATAEGTSELGDFGPYDLEDFMGSLPEGSVTYGVNSTRVTYNDTSTVLGTTTIPSTGIDLSISIVGVTGSIQLSL